MGRSWDELQREFRMVILRRGPVTMEEVAERMHVHRATVYRLMSGETRKPSGPMRDMVERVVSQVRQPDADPA